LNSKKTVVLGVTGSIAAYKAADICSKLVQQNIDVVVIMTDSAQKLICPKTFLTLSQNPVITDLWDVPSWQPGHIALADKASLFVVAPATANFLGKYANGIADDALTTYALSHSKNVIIAPAMNPKMWLHPAVKNNCEILTSRKVQFIGPAEGRVACGTDKRTGRLATPSDIVEAIIKNLN
jgi:phosphopantothenoylcysteine synthetase/decarboxylase